MSTIMSQAPGCSSGARRTSSPIAAPKASCRSAPMPRARVSCGAQTQKMSQRRKVRGVVASCLKARIAILRTGAQGF